MTEVACTILSRASVDELESLVPTLVVMWRRLQNSPGALEKLGDFFVHISVMDFMLCSDLCHAFGLLSLSTDELEATKKEALSVLMSMNSHELVHARKFHQYIEQQAQKAGKAAELAVVNAKAGGDAERILGDFPQMMLEVPSP